MCTLPSCCLQARWGDGVLLVSFPDTARTGLRKAEHSRVQKRRAQHTAMISTCNSVGRPADHFGKLGPGVRCRGRAHALAVPWTRSAFAVPCMDRNRLCPELAAGAAVAGDRRRERQGLHALAGCCIAQRLCTWAERFSDRAQAATRAISPVALLPHLLVLVQVTRAWPKCLPSSCMSTSPQAVAHSR